VVQSETWPQLAPTPQREQDEPPQSTSDSSPFRTPSLHAGAETQRPIEQRLVVQSEG
jgi:hypothetical protein